MCYFALLIIENTAYELYSSRVEVMVWSIVCSSCSINVSSPLFVGQSWPTRFLLSIFSDGQRVSPSVMVKLLHCDLGVMGLKYENNLSKPGVRLHIFVPPRAPYWQKPCALDALLGFSDCLIPVHKLSGTSFHLFLRKFVLLTGG